MKEGETARAEMIQFDRTKPDEEHGETRRVEVVRVEKGPEPPRTDGVTVSAPVMILPEPAPGPKPEHVGSAEMTSVEAGPPVHVDPEPRSVPWGGVVTRGPQDGEVFTVPQSVVEHAPEPRKRKRIRRTITYTE